jgi:quercetin dioxygenase-like cupin family protein
MTQKIVSNSRLLIANASVVPAVDLAKKGTENVQVRYLIDERHGSDRFALRLYSVGKGGHTPLDQHEYEHHVYVLSGQGLLKETQDDQPLRELRKGDFVFVPSNAIHQFINERDEPLVFLCVKGNPKLYVSGMETRDQETGAEDSDRNFC